MNPVGKQQVLKLYKNLLRYGQQLKYTDKEYFAKRIRNDFQKNKYLESKEDIDFNFERGLTVLLRRSVV
ncbi:MIEF1 upstream open reading frame protein [Coccinella septempunctata]|uniref:MIEF1 upstream open reading frame protein n=1 Tax=Coccinella septempunctata TaxID=41139 RepID=UPI001D06B10D|nr:MIEF1 upstream open reading frame protein [Coccinella septempunctata]